MKLVSWNVWNRNQDIDKFKKFFEEQDADVFALQELTCDHIEALRSLKGYNLHIADDFVEGEQLTYLGILTQLPVLDHGVIVLNADRKVSSSWIGRRNCWIECLESHYLAVSIGGINTIIVNVHLSCGESPAHRRHELERAIGKFSRAERIVICGDLNTFANPFINWFIGWFCGFGAGDIFTHEINSLDRFVRQRGMQRVPRRAVTFPRLSLHLDHIIVRGMDVLSCDIECESYGSDHVPVIVKLI